MPRSSFIQLVSDKSISITCSLYAFVLASIFILTAVNGLYNSLDVEYSRQNTTFLFKPEDRHADLIKSALVVPPLVPINPAYKNQVPQSFFDENPYKGIADVEKGGLTDLHVPPFLVSTVLAVKLLIVQFGPSSVVHAYYVLALACVFIFARKFSRGFWEGLLVFIAVVFSYPFLMILSRGNTGALISSPALIFCIYEILAKKRGMIAALFFAVAFNCRPNVLFLAPLFLTLGWKDCFKSLLVFGVAALLLLLSSYWFCVHFYDGYNYSVFQKALKNYYDYFVLKEHGNSFNNSLYGAFRPMITMFHPSDEVRARVLPLLLWSITLSVGFLITAFTFLYHRRQIDNYTFAFTLGALYILGSSVLATYHLFFLFVFLFMLSTNIPPNGKNRTHLLILAAVGLVLIPKNYLIFNQISLEVVINPALLSIALGLIFWWRTPAGEVTRENQAWFSALDN